MSWGFHSHSWRMLISIWIGNWGMDDGFNFFLVTHCWVGVGVHFVGGCHLKLCGRTFHVLSVTPGLCDQFHILEFGVMCCILSLFHMSSRIVANNSEPSFSFSCYWNLHGENITKYVLPLFFVFCVKFSACPNCLPYLLRYSYHFSPRYTGWVACGSTSVQGISYALIHTL